MNEESLKRNEILKGKTLQIYWYLLKQGNSGIREIQKELDLPSPSSVSYHINKLVQVDLVSQDQTGKYFIKEEVDTGIIGLRRRLIPRFMGYLSFYLVIMIVFTIIVLFKGDTPLLVEILFVIFSLVGILIFIFEIYQLWRIQPI
ncbi:MAG: hypothetical protein ACFFB2_06580 [Promethearchaeota archaeon]